MDVEGTLCVEDLMSEHPWTLNSDATIGEAISLLTEHEVRHIPMLFEEKLVGLVSDRDLRRVEGMLVQCVTDQQASGALLSAPVMSLLGSRPFCVTPTLSVDGLIERFLNDRVSAYPVVDSEGRLLGMVSYMDVLSASRGRWAVE